MAISDYPPIFGRDEELTTLTGVLDQAAGGKLRLCFIEGEPGIGKTRLLTEAVKAVDGDFDLFSGQGRSMERERPFGVIADALGLDGKNGDPDRDAITALLKPSVAGPGHTEGEYAETRYFVVEAVVALLGQWAEQGPLLLTLEDLHWADPSSLLVLDQVAKRLSELPIGIVATLRPSPRSHALEQLRRSVSPEDSLELGLLPLDQESIDSLAASLLGDPPGPELRRLMEGAAGNPFFITELLSALADDGRLESGDGLAELTTSGTLPTLRATVLHRLGFLAPDTLDLLRVAAVTGSWFSLDDLSVILEAPPTDLLGLLDEPMRAGFVVASGRDFEFRHHLVWDALYHDLPLASREALHAQVARRLADAGRPASQVASHFLAGASPGDRQALDWLEKAASEAISRAPEVAAELLQGALQLTGDSAATYDRLSVELATALTWAGRMDEAETVLEDLVARVPVPEEDVNVRLGLARIQIIQGKPAAARSNYERLIGEGSLSGRRLARALIDQAVACLMSGDVAGAEMAAADALKEGRAAGDDPAICGALSASAWVHNLSGRTGQAVGLAEEAVGVAEASSVRETARRYPHVFLAVVLVDADRLEEARRMFDYGRRLAEAFGDAWQLPIQHLGAALVDFYAGAYPDAETALATADQIVAEVGTRMLQVWSSALAAQIAIERDELEKAGVLLEAAEAHVAQTGPGMGYDWLLWGRARLLEAQGESEAAATLLGNAWELAESLGIVSQRRLIGPDLVRLLHAVGEADDARAKADAMSAAAELNGIPSASAAAERCQALVQADPDRALAAVKLAGECPKKVEYARTCEDAGAILVRSGREEEAKSVLAEAASQYQRSGARRSERRVEAELRRLGVGRGSRQRRDRPATGWEALTPAELEVSSLAAEGLTNPEIGRRLFISPRTVETHLSHVYAKLGVSSRVELAAVSASRE